MMRTRRTIPPSAPPLRLRDIFRGLRAAVAPQREAEALARDLCAHYGVRYAFLVSSGKGALTLILRALGALSPRRKVIIPAYTCFSAPASVLKADLDLVLCDIDPATLDFDFTALERVADADTLGIVATHLLGIPSCIEKVRSIARRVGAFVVEDAAQAMGGRLHGQPLGTLTDAGFFSLGRGKVLTCGEGGIILTTSTEIGEALSREVAALRPEPPAVSTAKLLKLLLMRLFIHPALYWIPASLPFLGLGRTIFPRDFPTHRLSDAAAAVLRDWRTLLAETNAAHCANARSLSDALRTAGWSAGLPATQHLPYLRLPVLLETIEDKVALCAISKAHGLGISPLYPSGIHAIPEIRDRFGTRTFPGATAAAARLVTFPVHHLTGPRDRDRICAVLSAELRGSAGMHIVSPELSPAHIASSG